MNAREQLKRYRRGWEGAGCRVSAPVGSLVRGGDGKLHGHTCSVPGRPASADLAELDDLLCECAQSLGDLLWVPGNERAEALVGTARTLCEAEDALSTPRGAGLAGLVELGRSLVVASNAEGMLEDEDPEARASRRDLAAWVQRVEERTEASRSELEARARELEDQVHAHFGEGDRAIVALVPLETAVDRNENEAEGWVEVLMSLSRLGPDVLVSTTSVARWLSEQESLEAHVSTDAPLDVLETAALLWRDPNREGTLAQVLEVAQGLCEG